MSKHLKKVLALLLCLVMIVGLLPTVSFAANSRIDSSKNEKKNSDEIWATINRIEDEKIIATRGRNATAKDYAAIVDDVIEAVEESDSYVDGTIERHGDFFFWVTEDGEPQGYSPSLRARVRATGNANATEEELAGKTETVSFAVKGGSPSSMNVAVFQPYIGIDSSFTTQYADEGTSIAQATGGTGTTYKTTNATLTQIGASLSNCGVVIFDSHGTTDYENGDDYVTQANASYLCLQSNSGWTTADKASATGTYGSYYHAFNGGSNGSMRYYCVDGTAMANHMSNNNPNNLVWMAICLGMATDGLWSPLRNHGVGVVYGYSQSTSFDGDYDYEEDFWTKMKAGEDVATAFAYMTRTYKWDPAYAASSSYNTIGKARYNYVAFPNIVSAEDTYQGHRTTNPSSATAANSTAYNSAYGACNLQTVNSTWTLFTQYEVTASSNNTNYGTVSLSGTTITASPKTGYTYASPAYTVSPSGAATVTQNGNTFTISNVSNNCNVQINFAAKQKATVTYIANSNDITSTVGSSTQLYTGDSITLPSVDTGSGADAEYTFLGWVTQTCDGVTTAPSYLAKGSSYQLTGTSTTFYALYSKTTTTGGGSGDYTKVTSTSDMTDGKYLIVYESGPYVMDGNQTGDSNWASNDIEVTINNSTIATSTTIDGYAFTYSASTGSFKGASGYYISGKGSNNNGTNWGTTEIGTTVSISGGNATITSSASGGNIMMYNPSSTGSGFRFYKSTSTQQAVQLYKKGAGSTTTTYTTSPVPHTHSTTAVAAVAATCGESGSIACYYCAGCGKYFTTAAATTELSDENRITAPTGNHSYGSWVQDGAVGHTHTCTVCGNSETVAHSYTGQNSVVVTAPTATESGYTTYTCDVCSYSYTGNYTAALGYNYTVSFSVPAGVTTPADQTSNTNTGITLPTPVGTPSNTEHEYTFLGWVEATANDVTVKPTVYAAGTNYVAQQQITLKALYSYVVSDGNNTEQVWTLMESASTLQAGQTVVFASSGKGATAGDISSSIMASVSTEFSGDNSTITSLGANTVQMTVGGTEGAWTFSNGSALLGTTAAKSMAWGSGTTTWTVSITSGSATIYSTNTDYGRILYNSSSPRFTTYTSATNTSMLLPQIYYLAGSAGTTYYTTELAAPCAHTNLTAHAAAAATCTVAGNSAYWTCDDCGKYFSDNAANTEITQASTVIAALGHSWGAWTVTAEPTANEDGSRTRTCSRCGATDTEAISNQPVVTGYNLTTNGDVLVNAYISVPAYLKNNDSGMYVTIDGGTEHILLSTFTETGDGFKIPQTVPAKNMQDTVTLRLYASNGSQIALEGANEANNGGGITYSVQGYINQVLADADAYDASYPGLSALCKAMSAYGSYAQVQQNYTTATGAAYNPVTVDAATASEVAAISTSSIPAAATASTATTSGSGVSFYGASLVMLSKMTLRFYFTYTGSGTLRCGGTALTQKGDYYYFDVTDIAATDFGVGQTIMVTDGTNSCTVSGYSVNRYIYKVLTTSSSANMVTLAKAIANYGLKATAYYSANNH